MNQENQSDPEIRMDEVAPQPQPIEEPSEAYSEAMGSIEPENRIEQEPEKPVSKTRGRPKVKQKAQPSQSKPIFSEGDIPASDEEVGEYTEEERRAMLERMEETMVSLKEKDVIKGKVLRIIGDEIVVDIGFKSEAIVPKGEFAEEVKEGDTIDVYLEELEDDSGQVLVSKRKADFMRVWQEIKDAYETGSHIRGIIKRRIKGGMVVDIMGVDAFLPGSQIALRQIPDFNELINEEMDFRVIKLNKIRRNIVVSRRIVLEEERNSRRKELLSEIEEGQIREGVVKNITDFGVFIDLGGLDGLLHITDMSWSRIKHPAEMLRLGDRIKVKILKFDNKKERISLGLKQLTESPWEKVEERYPEGARIRGRIVNITKYGAFVELEKGIEGLVHVSEMSWTKHINHPSEVVSVGDTVDVIVLSVDKDNQKISLGIKQLEPDPWTILAAKYPPGSRITGSVRNLTSFGAFIEIEDGIDGLVHISDMSWTKRIMHPSEVIHKGDKVDVVVLNIDPENRRVSLGLKQIERDPWPDLSVKYAIGKETEGKITRMSDRGVTVELEEGIEGFVPVTQLGKEVNRPQEAFAEGDVLPLKVIEFDKTEHRIVLSVNAFFDSRAQTDLEKYLSDHPTKTVKLEEIVSETMPRLGIEKAEEKPEVTELLEVKPKEIEAVAKEQEAIPPINKEIETKVTEDIKADIDD